MSKKLNNKKTLAELIQKFKSAIETDSGFKNLLRDIFTNS
jgi:hypothetical protein